MTHDRFSPESYDEYRARVCTPSRYEPDEDDDTAPQAVTTPVASIPDEVLAECRTWSRLNAFIDWTRAHNCQHTLAALETIKRRKLLWVVGSFH